MSVFDHNKLAGKILSEIILEGIVKADNNEIIIPANAIEHLEAILNKYANDIYQKMICDNI